MKDGVLKLHTLKVLDGLF